MKILEVIPLFIDGGAERFVVDIATEFSDLGHQVQVCALYAEDEEGMKYFPDWDQRVERSSLNKKLGADLSVLFRLKKLIREFKPDVIHTHLSTVNYVALLQFLSFKKIPSPHGAQRCCCRGDRFQGKDLTGMAFEIQAHPSCDHLAGE